MGKTRALVTLYRIVYCADTKCCFGLVRTPIRYVTPVKDRRSFALQQESHQIITLMCEQKPYAVWFSCRRESYRVECEHSLKLMFGKRTKEL